MANDIDHMANFLWNDLVGRGYAYPPPAFKRYPGDIEFGPPHDVPPVPPQQSRLSTRRQIEIESLPPPASSTPADQTPPLSVPPRTNAPTAEKDASNIHKSIQNGLCGSKLNIGVCAILILLVAIGIFFAVLRPKSPSFRLDDITIYNFTATGANLRYCLDATISSHNPNHHVEIHYRGLEAFIVYGPQRLTDRMAPLFPEEFYQGHNDLIVMTTSLSGESVLSPEAEVHMGRDRDDGAVRLEVGVKGRLKWKVGSWNSSWWYMYISCPANIRFQTPNAGVQIGDGLKFSLRESCFVDTKLDR